ncbi:LUC7-domain-containing protein [Polyplosphaeria fusca]|uniref:LUC7-domain-containing protein n=1 Tax=Polyplosphaeria fusca TaxID=682080 RepID=A0A9P4UZN8_9PLEO|nr:LUC7-domain-containing protein [Polyplosphaeria fusca]
MAAAETRRLLEQLMGNESMYGTDAQAPTPSMKDSNVCRSYIVGTCPHDLFTNTKQDFGVCKKQHVEALKLEYEAMSQEQKRALGFEFDYLRDMTKIVEDCNFRIRQAQQRLEKTPEEIRQTNDLYKQIGHLTETIEAGLTEVNIMGDEEQVNMAVTEFFKLRSKKQEKEERERDLKSLADTGGPSGHQKLQVCEVCGAYLSRLDNDRRLADHFYGKLHLGYAQMRQSYEKLQKELAGKQAPRDWSSQADRDGGHRGGHGGYGGGGGGGYYGGGGGGGYGGGGRRGGGRSRGGGGRQRW